MRQCKCCDGIGKKLRVYKEWPIGLSEPPSMPERFECVACRGTGIEGDSQARPFQMRMTPFGPKDDPNKMFIHGDLSFPS